MSTSLPVTPRESSSWADIKDRLRDMEGWLFRGHRSAAWELSTSLERAVSNSLDRIASEEWLVRRFKAAAGNYLLGRVPDDSDALGWLALMQHHGAPTRLLDWTSSPYVAAYFAVEEVDPRNSCAVWAVDSIWFRKRALARFSTVDDSASVDLDVWWARREMPPFDGVVVASPARLNERQSVQQGVFLVNGNLSRSFEYNVRALAESDEDLRSGVRLFVVPGSWRAEVLRDLRLMNITRASLYPGLDGFSQSLKYALLFEDPSHRGSREAMRALRDAAARRNLTRE